MGSENCNNDDNLEAKSRKTPVMDFFRGLGIFLFAYATISEIYFVFMGNEVTLARFAIVIVLSSVLATILEMICKNSPKNTWTVLAGMIAILIITKTLI